RRAYRSGCELVDGGTKLANVERFREHEVDVHAFVGGAHFRRKVRRQNHDFTADAAFSHFVDQFHAASVRHFVIDNDDVELLQTGIDPGERGVAVFDAGEVVARSIEDVAQGENDRWLVIDCQDPEGGRAHEAV